MLGGDEHPKGQGNEAWGKLVESQEFAKFEARLLFFFHPKLREKYPFTPLHARVLLGLINK